MAHNLSSHVGLGPACQPASLPGQGQARACATCTPILAPSFLRVGLRGCKLRGHSPRKMRSDPRWGGFYIQLCMREDRTLECPMNTRFCSMFFVALNPSHDSVPCLKHKNESCNALEIRTKSSSMEQIHSLGLFNVTIIFFLILQPPQKRPAPERAEDH